MENEEADSAPRQRARGLAGHWRVVCWVALIAAMEASLPVESHFMHGAGFRERAICGVLVAAGGVACGLVLRFFGD